MPLPTPEKTWVYRKNIPFFGATSAATNQRFLRTLKNLLTDTIIGINGLSAHIYNQGSIANIAGTTFGISAPVADNRFNPADIGNVIGKTLKLRGMTTVGNNGNFVITDQVFTGGAWQLRYVNATGAAEAVTGSANVLAGLLPFPLVLRHSVSRTHNNTPTADDGEDVWDLDANITWNTATNGIPNGTTAFASYAVVKNPVTGTEFSLLAGYNSPAGTNHGAAGVLSIATAPTVLGAPNRQASNIQPQIFLAGAQITIDGTSVSPVLNSDFPAGVGGFISDAAADGRLFVMQSTDGEQLRVFWFVNGLARGLIYDAFPTDVNADWTGQPEVPVVAGMGMSLTTAESATYARLNDLTNSSCSRIPSNQESRPDIYGAMVYLTAEGQVTGALGERITVVNALSGEWPLMPIGVASENLGYEGALAKIPDLWWTSTGAPTGITFPAGTSRQFMKVGHFVVPWDGSIPELM